MKFYRWWLTLRIGNFGSRFQILVLACFVALLCFLADWLGSMLVLRPQMLWPLWPGCAFLIAVLLLSPRRIWPVLLAAGLTGFAVYDLLAHLALRSIVVFILGDGIEILVAILGLSYVFGGVPRLNSIKSFAWYFLFAVIVSPLAGTSIATAAFAGNFWIRWRIGFFTEALALLTLTPLILSWAGTRHSWMRKSRATYVEAATLIAGLSVLGYVAFVAHSHSSMPVLLYSLLPFLLWSALRFGVMGVSASMTVVASLSIWGAVHGLGPFTNAEPLNNVTSLQLFLFVAAMTFIVLAVLVEEQRETELTLRELEVRERAEAQKIQTVLDTVPVSVFIARDLGCSYISANRTAYKEFGLRSGANVSWTALQSETLGFRVMRDGVEIPTAELPMQQAAASGRPVYGVPLSLVFEDGSQRHTVFNAVPLLAEDGSPVGVVGTSMDITDRKLAEDALRQSQQRLAGLIASAMDSIISVDEQQKIVLFNAAAEKMFRCPAAEAMGQPLARFIPERFRSTHNEQIRQFAKTGVINRALGALGSLWALRATGEEFQIEASISQVEFDDKKISTVILRDITDEKMAEEALRRSEERFSKVFRSSPLPVTISTEAEGRYLDVNEAFLQMMKHERRDVIGRTSGELSFWAEPSHRVDMLRELKERGRVTGFPTQFRTSKQEIRTAEVSAEVVELDGLRCLLAITNDITDRRRLEEQFRQAQKMETVGRLAGGVAHDFNNLLGVIIGYCDLSTNLISPGSPLSRHLEQIKKASNRAVSLTQQLLAFSRQQVVFPKVLDLNEVVRNMISMLQRLVGEDVGISFQPTLPIGSIRADPGQVEQVLMNLVVNARDAMPNGGRINVETAHAQLNEHYVSRHPGAHTGEHVILVVRDTGCGMDEVTKSMVFEPFFTTKEIGQGTGLGLSTVYGIVKQSGGYIFVDSEVGVGTTFEIYFPRVAAEIEHLVESREGTEFPGGSETILVVEDDEPLRELTVSMLLEAGYRVIEAGNAEAALDIAKTSDPRIDLLLADVIMPGMSGIDLLEQTRTLNLNCRSLLMSGYSGDVVRQRSGSMPETLYLTKPFSRSSLLKKVRSALRDAPASGIHEVHRPPGLKS